MNKNIILILIILPMLGACSSVAVNPDNIEVEDHNLVKLHEGNIYSSTTQVSISSGSTTYLKANSSREVHLLERRIYSVTSGSNLDYNINLYEGGEDSSSIGLLPSFNVNRNKPNTNTFSIFETVSGVNLSQSAQLPFGNKLLSDKKYSSMAISTTEYILKNDTSYYLEITNNDGGILTLDLVWIWYEE